MCVCYLTINNCVYKTIQVNKQSSESVISIHKQANKVFGSDTEFSKPKKKKQANKKTIVSSLIFFFNPNTKVIKCKQENYSEFHLVSTQVNTSSVSINMLIAT